MVLRYDGNKGGYLIVDRRELSFESSLNSGINCDYIDDTESLVSMEEGDVMGFVNGDNIRVALVALPEGINSTLKVFDFSLTTSVQNSVSERLNASIQQEGMSDQQFSALFRIVLSEYIAPWVGLAHRGGGLG